MKYVNTDAHERVWTSLQDEHGRTLGLQPGETAELNLPDDFEDPYLKPVESSRGRKTRKTADQPAQEDEPTPATQSDSEPAEADASGKED